MMRGTAVAAFAGIPCQVGGRERHLPRFCGDSVPGGRQEVTPGTLLQRYRGRWTVEKRHLERFRGDSVAGGRQEVLPDTLLQEFRARWTAEKRHLEHFRWNTVPGGRRRRDTWNAFAGIPCQVGGRK